MPPLQDPLVGQRLADRFEILSRIGEGGTGVVYKAKQLAVDRIIAIKVLGAHVSQDPSWVKRFHNEARAAARLDHPNTVRLIDFGETKEGLLFIAMEFLHGRSLADEIAKVGRLHPQRVLRILSQMLQSLQEAHSQGIIHRDIKPDNVFLMDTKGQGDFVKVLDFSVAKMDSPDAQATLAGTVFGTPAYMSPEQGRGVKLTPQSDIYACGIVAYEMLTGKPPFDGRLPMEVVMAHLRQKPAPLQGFPEPIATMVMKALEKTPERRQQSSDEFDHEVQQCLEMLYPRPASQALNAVGSGPTPSTPQPAVPPLQQGSQGRAGHGPPPLSSAPEQRTMMAQPAPVFPQQQQQQQGGYSSQQQQQGYPPQQGQPGRTVAFNAPMNAQGPINTGGGSKTIAFDPSGPNQDGVMGTVFIPDGPMGISPQVREAQRQAFLAQKKPPPPTSPLFWVGWALLGISIGLALHFFWPHGA